MGFSIRKSFKIAPGVRLNVGKRSSSISVGNKYGHTTISTSGGRHPSGHMRSDLTRMIENQGNVSEKKRASNRRFLKVCSIIMLVIAIIALFLAIVGFATAGAMGIVFLIVAIPCLFFWWIWK